MLLIERDINLIVAHAIVTYDLRLFNAINHLEKKVIKFDKWAVGRYIREIKMKEGAYRGITPESYVVFDGLYERLKQHYMAWLLFNKYNLDYTQLKHLLGAEYEAYMRNYQNYRSSRRRERKNAGNEDFFRRLALVANPHKKLTLESTIHLYCTYTPTQVINRMRSAIKGIKEGCVIPRQVVANHRRTLKRWTGLDFHKFREIPFGYIKSKAVERFFEAKFDVENMEDFLTKEYSKKLQKNLRYRLGALVSWSEKKNCKTYEEFREFVVARLWTKINYARIPRDTLGDIDMPPRFKNKRRYTGNGKRYARYKQLFS